MTKEEFIKQYCERSNISEEKLMGKLGFIAEPCDCGDKICQGWQMTSPDELALREEIKKIRSEE